MVVNPMDEPYLWADYRADVGGYADGANSRK
jgi:hypothetical protein